MKQRYIGLVLCLLILGSVGISSARQSQDGRSRPESVAGAFDYYVLALSWSPTFCLIRPENAQCKGQGYGFVLHGLWPQYAKGGWPQSCPPMARLTPTEWAQGRALFVTPQLLKHEWAKHGTCSGLGAAAYLEHADNAMGAVKVPAKLQPFNREIYFQARDIAQMFRESNPGLPVDGVVVMCRGPQLSEVRVCMDKELSFQACGKGVRSNCRSGDIRVPPVR